MNKRDITVGVKERYGEIARRLGGGTDSCCGPMLDSGCECDPISSGLYDEAELATLPSEILRGSLGCGNPTALAQLNAGETVLDLGSGSGIDVFLSARRVGPTRKAYGLDMTDEMLALARSNQQKMGIHNVEFLKGEIEHIPLPDNSVDVILSNCVINLSADKDQVFAEAFRVLKPGGRLAVSDIVVNGAIPEQLQRQIELWTGCVTGALEKSEYSRQLAQAGFTTIEVQPTRVYGGGDLETIAVRAGLDPSIAKEGAGKFMSAFIRAGKPIVNRTMTIDQTSCCDPQCCAK